jgi:hypothetical protein
LTIPQTVWLLAAVLPSPGFDVQLALDIVAYYQHRHEVAYRSHRKRRLARFDHCFLQRE